jgi:hypothetical protein
MCDLRYFVPLSEAKLSTIRRINPEKERNRSKRGTTQKKGKPSTSGY